MTKQKEALQLLACTVLGGTGYIFSPGDKVNIRFGPEILVVQSADGSKAEDIPFLEVVELSISGRGSVTTGGGFIGGGFGVEEALEGMAIGKILNVLTTRTKIHTFIALVTHLGELHLHYGGMEPGALRIVLSKVFTKLRRLDPIWMNERLARLETLLSQKAISDREFDYLKCRLLDPPIPTVPVPTIQEEERGFCNKCYKTVLVDEVTKRCTVCGTECELSTLIRRRKR
jgi:hypothetical protein